MTTLPFSEPRPIAEPFVTVLRSHGHGPGLG